MYKKVIKKKIIDELEKTKNQIIKYQEATQPIVPDVAIGRLSRMDAINNKSIIESALRQARVKLNKLKLVLSKVDGDDFGICIKCRKTIPVERILIKPESLYCVQCTM